MYDDMQCGSAHIYYNIWYDEVQKSMNLLFFIYAYQHLELFQRRILRPYCAYTMWVTFAKEVIK